jgi:plasmid maintenance system killer protein
MARARLRSEKIFNEIRSTKFQAIKRIAIRKFFQLHGRRLHDLRFPGAALEDLKDSRARQYSIRINDDIAPMVSMGAAC